MNSGDTLGPFRILDRLGEGGMGEVYRARDTALGREVAIKVLPDAFATDADRLARFEREAKTLAALNHPNIAHLYGLERSAGMPALVMELVEGATLAERLASAGTGLPLDEVVAIARQIAEALAAAHEQGIVHRDLKPANVKVRDDGTVKVLDFGLAKAFDTSTAQSGAGASAMLSLTLTSPAMTQVGMIIGTAAYMSPEQAKGRPADKRSDVWAFGCVLYELVTGVRPFQAEDVSETLAAVLRSEPDWDLVPPDVPASVRTLMQRCLRKDQRLRVADISIAQFVLVEATALTPTAATKRPVEPDPAVVQQRIDVAVADARRSLLRRRVLPIAGGAALAVVASIGIRETWFAGAAAPPAVTRFTVARPSTGASAGALGLSPDGTTLAYISNGLLNRRRLDEFESQVVPGFESVGPTGVVAPTFSPDGTSVAFHLEGAIRRIPVNGGALTTVCQTELVRGISWDQTGIVFSVPAGVFRCAAGGGSRQQLAAAGDDEELAWPQILPGGRSLLLTVARVSRGDERWDEAAIVVQSLETGARQTVVAGASNGRYVESGHLLYVVAGIVFARRFDPVRGVAAGEPAAVVEGVRRATNGLAFFSTSANGTLAYSPGPAAGRATVIREIAVATRAGAITKLGVPALPYGQVRASRDGKRLVMDSDDGKEAMVWVYDLGATQAPRRLTFGGRNRFPIWSPDGERVAFQSDREGDQGIFVQRLNGSGIERLTRAEKGQSHVPESWSPDGRYLVYAVTGSTGPSIWVLSLGDRTSKAFGDVRTSEPTGAVFSPDGRHLAFHLQPDGAPALSPSGGVFVEPFPFTGERYQAPKVSRDFQPVWSRDGGELFYVPSAASGEIVASHVTATSGVTFAKPESLPAMLTGNRLSGGIRAFDVLPDGRFVGLTPDTAQFPPEIRVVINWGEEMKKLVGAGR